MKLAREACGLTQDVLSDLSGVPLGTLGQIEVGRIFEPSGETVESIAGATGFPVSFFYRGPLPDLPDGNYRKFARGTSKAEKQVRALTRQMVEIVRDADADESIRLPDVEIASIPELGSIEEIEYHIGDVRASLRVGTRDPIPHLMRAVERAGVVVLRLPVAMEDHDGFSVWPYFGLRGSRPVIVATGDRSGDRDRFTVAHELGHLILHSARRGVNPGQAEDEANRFAGALLIPEAIAVEALCRPLTLDVLMGVKATYGVSIQALVMRAFDLRVINATQKASIFKQLSKRGWRTEEPVRVDREQPILLPEILDRLGGEGTVQERAARMGLSPFSFSTLVALIAPAPQKNPAQSDQNA